MHPAPFVDFEHGISAIDAGYKRPMLAAIHLLCEDTHAALIDVCTSRSVPKILGALRTKGIAPERVGYLILTHVHLDHAGGAGAMLRHLPNAQVVVHPRGARHMIDPSRLIADTISVYGETVFREEHSEVVPISPERVIETHDGLTLDFNGRTLLFLDTPGHARHHHCVFDARSRSFFTGDSFGISYRELDAGPEECIFPTSSPNQFDPDAAHTTIDRLMGYAPEYMFLAHFSRVGHTGRLAADLHRLIEAHAALGERLRDAGPARDRLLEDGVREILVDHVEAHGAGLSRKRILDVISMDIELNAQGIGAWLDSRTAAPMP